jgi:hypothetical protein
MERMGFLDIAAIHIASALLETHRDLTPGEMAEKAYDLAWALADERARRELEDDETPRPRVPLAEATRWQPPARRPQESGSRTEGHP